MPSHFVFPASLVTIALAAAGCASSSGRKAPSVAMQAAAGDLGPANLQWTGKFRSIQQQLSTVDQRAHNVASGSVVLTAPDERETHVQISVSGPAQDASQLSWVIAPGACRSGTIPLMAVSQFPEIRMSQGHGELDQVLSMPLPTAGSLHVNIYNGPSTDESGVMTCADLKLERRGASE
ncbi:MAG TPA: hypothetical protein VJU87_08615 [Gemmatimonadaceae bacterium]|nr:hypothetical protein [Gemmatimonadaceae bacterium]